MPKRTNVNPSHGGANIVDLNSLHDQMVKAAHQALQNEIANGEIKPATLNTIRQICADAGVNPTREASNAMDGLLWSLPTIDPDLIATRMNSRN